MGLIAIDRVWSPSFCFGVQGFHSNDFLAFSFQYIYANLLFTLYKHLLPQIKTVEQSNLCFFFLHYSLHLPVNYIILFLIYIINMYMFIIVHLFSNCEGLLLYFLPKVSDK